MEDVIPHEAIADAKALRWRLGTEEGGETKQGTGDLKGKAEGSEVNVRSWQEPACGWPKGLLKTWMLAHTHAVKY